jgi:hypothetical protein
VVISPADRDSGTAALWGSLLATDAPVPEALALHQMKVTPGFTSPGSG